MTNRSGDSVPPVVGLDVGSTTAKIAVPANARALSASALSEDTPVSDMEKESLERESLERESLERESLEKESLEKDSLEREYHTRIVQAHHWKKLLDEIPDGSDCRIVSTGYFRQTVPHELAVTEITAAIHGVRHFIPEADLIIDIGGQDVKVIDTNTSDFQLNDKCSAGTGAFLELVARYFDIKPGKLAGLSARAQRIAPVNQTCGVFAVSEMISRMVEGYSMEEVVAGVHHAFARRISFMVRKDAENIVAIGGVSKNGGIISALSEVIGKEVRTPGEPQIVNAVGAARYGMGIKGHRTAI